MIGPTMGGVTSLRVFCGVWQKPVEGAINLATVCNTAVNSPVKPLVFANFLAPNMTSVYADVATRVGQALGTPSELIEGSGFDQLRDGSVDVAFLCGLPYIRLCRERPGMLRPLAAPVLNEARYQDRPVYFSDVIVSWDSPVRSFGDLRGRSWAYNDPDSFSGCLLVRHHLLLLGETEAFFGRLTFSGRHQESIRRVLSGEIDASAIDSQVLGVERLRNPDLARKLRVIAVMGPSTIPLVVATASVPETVRIRLGEALCELDRDPETRNVLASGLIRRFTPIGDGAYDDIRRVTSAVENSAPSASRAF
jgi:phosphonate transport system substrate-binding protein